jgi:hypothetical protein
MLLTLPEYLKIIDASGGPVTTNGGVTCDYVSLKNVKRAWIVLNFTQAVGHATGVDPKRATAVDGTGAAALGTAVPWWLNEDTATLDALTRQTDAVTGDVAATIKKKMMVFQIDPATLGDYDVLGCDIDDSSQATNFVSVNYFLEMRYSSDLPPSAITD